MSFLGDKIRRPPQLDGPEEAIDAPLRYAPLDRVYSAASLCVGSSNVMSKKVKARKLLDPDQQDAELPHFDRKRPPLCHVYSRCYRKRPREAHSFFDVLLAREAAEKKRARIGDSELVLGVRSGSFREQERSKPKDSVNNAAVCSNLHGKKLDSRKNSSKDSKRWVRLRVDDVRPTVFVGLPCKVYWPLDADWYTGRVVGYDSGAHRHCIKYEDGDKEDIVLSNEKIKFFISSKEMENLNLRLSVKSTHGEDNDYDEMVVMAASLDDCHDLEPGDIIWAKLTGYVMWPAIVVDESLIANRKGLNKISAGSSVLVQFFGTHDFARVKPKQVISFLKGLISSFHLKSKKAQFIQSLEEAKMYLSEQKLPRRMLMLRDDLKDGSCESVSSDDEGSTDSDEDCIEDQGIKKILEGLRTSPYVIGDLQIISLGKVVKDSEYFQDDRFIWPEGYTAWRKFTSISDPGVCTLYKMEVLRDDESKIRPLFRVTLENGEQIKGPTPSACWNKIYKRIRKAHDSSMGIAAEDGEERIYGSGTDMFGFSNPEVVKLIKGLSRSKVSSKLSTCKLTSQRYQNLPAAYRPVRVKWKDLDKCNVCHMDEEYENNLFLQCDKCRMMVHARCYGELEPVDGVLWFCNLCRPGAPNPPPPCCLCPVIGGAMKPTTDGRWAHLACAIWIPETCLSDIKKMEPIDGLKRIKRDRWKLLCTICGVGYGACIQCSNNACRVAYHPLCARAAGLCVELEDEDRLHLLSVDDNDNQSYHFISFCKRHRAATQDRLMPDERIGQVAHRCADYVPPCNPSGCARTEPYDYFGRRGRKEPEALAAASLKRLFVENQPYLVGGHSQHDLLGGTPASGGVAGSRFSASLQRLKASQLDAPIDILSMAEKYNFMFQTIRKRLAFGKSSIHGFGIFAKHPHRAGDMVIEYIGELVRPPIADRRERLIYNSLVGAGTYMFRIDDERVIDATRAGSIAHLINHSCEPNCYSRVISVNGDEHIIIFAKRDIKRWEELTYDYRFFSIDEQLSCYCGFPRCRGVVNDAETEEQAAKLYAPRSELIDWKDWKEE